MRLRLEPAPPWAVPTSTSTSRDAIARCINAHADRLGTAHLDATGRVIATGHQAWLWHPGILAKDMAMVAACQSTGASPLHLVVDQDAHEALSITVPTVDDEELGTRTLRLVSHDPAVPTGWQPAVDVDAVRERLGSFSLPGRVDTDLIDPLRKRLFDALTDLPPYRTLAEQIAVVLTRLMRPYCGDLSLVFASDLVEIFDYDEVLRDARACAEAYNRAVAAQPNSGIAPLMVERERVELPVWACRWNSPRQRVFADLADSEPLWTFANGEPVDREQYDLAPKALLLTAIMRSRVCDLFIHGSGGAGVSGGPGGYDRITEQWWADWRGETLAPMALATADVYLGFDVPVADREDVTRAVWYQHHLPHNIDRVSGEPDPRKVALFNVKGKAAYERLQRINADLVAAHPELMREADERLRRVRTGLQNAALAAKRDWCFAFYPSEKIETLRQRIEAAFPEPGP